MALTYTHVYCNSALVPLMDIKPGRYQHYKGGEYQVYDVATHSEDLSKLVVYRPLYGDRNLWVRPLPMFTESVCVDGQDVPRFVYLGPSPDSLEGQA